MIIRARAYPRAALIGNPSDGFFGKTIAFTFRNFHAEVVLYETPELEILPNSRDHCCFQNLDALVNDVNKFGYYGGIRLLKAAIKRVHDYCREHGTDQMNRNFTIRYHTTIPPHLGLAGSSAIITACVRALMAFFEIEIPPPLLANLVLSVETDELGIPAGLQDRVAQAYDRPMFMDFARETMEAQGYGSYEELPADRFDTFYVAYRTELSEGSEVMHANLRYRFNKNEPEVVDAMQYWSDLTLQVRDLLLARRYAAIAPLIDANFDRRRSICPISEGNIRMVEAARAAGASAKFTGSGGAIIGTCPDDGVFAALGEQLGELGVKVIRPVLAPPPLTPGKASQ